MKAILAIDGTEVSKPALDMLLRMPAPATSEIVLLTVLPPAPPLATGMQKWQELRTEIQAAHDRAREALQAAADPLQTAGFHTRIRVKEGHPSHVVIDTASGEHADLILVGSHDRGPLSRFILGSTSHGVLLHAGCSVLVARPTTSDRQQPLNILIAYDGSETARTTLESATVRHWVRGAKVTILMVHELVSMYRADLLQEESESFREREERMRELLERQAKALRPHAGQLETLLKSDASPRESILATAREAKADLIVVGEKGHSAIRHFLLGSVAHGVANRAECSVLVAR